MSYYNNLSLSYGADDAHYDRIDYGRSFCGNSTTGADQGLDIDPDANDGSGDILVDEALLLIDVLLNIASSTRVERLIAQADKRYWRRLAALQPAAQVEYIFGTEDDLPF